MDWRAAVQRAWLTRGPLALALWPLGQLYGLLVRLRPLARRVSGRAAWRAPVPVIVVGNVVAGGAGKTPVVMALVEHLRSRGRQPAVVSRGHGRRPAPGDTAQALEVTAHTPVHASGDEPALIHARTGVPVFVARERAQAVVAALARHPGTDVIVCDDGLQHLGLARDIEIIVFDDRGTGNGWLLPAGPLREPCPRAADALLATGQRPPPEWPGIARWHAPRRLAGHAVSADGRRIALADLAAQPVDAIAGIAQPDAFFDMLRAQGLRLRHCTALADHAAFTAGQLPADDPQVPLLCTEKDALKLWPQRPRAWAVPLQLALPRGLLDDIDARLARWRPAGAG